MDGASSLPRIRKHEDRDGGRHGSTRDYYVSPIPHTSHEPRGTLTHLCSFQSSRDDRRDRARDRHGDRDRERRRSRSPHHRSSRHEVDSYSSSRGYREREREDRYTGREARRDDRGAWERDRGDRRRDDRPRGGDDDRRRERDFYGDRGDRQGGRGGGRAERDEFAQQRGARKKSASPPPKKKEPTPDLTDIVPITERKRRMTQWDIKPQGWENVTAEQAKLSGMLA